MKAYIEKVRHTLRHEGMQSVLDRSARYCAYRLKRAWMSKGATEREWEALRGTRAGERAFLLGNGPSLNQTELYLLGDEATMCFNRFDLILDRFQWFPTYFTVIDDRVLLDSIAEVNAISRVSGRSFFPDIHPYNIDFRPLIEKREDVQWLFLDRPDFSTDLPSCGINKTVANVGLQILAYLGFTEIYLLGVDMTYSLPTTAKVDGSRNVTATEDDDENHFDPRYFGAGRQYHVPMLDETFLKFREARKFFDERGVSVRNATVGGVLEEFERISLDDVLQFTDEEKLGRLQKAISARALSPDLSVEHLLSTSRRVQAAEEVEPEWDAFLAGAEQCNEMVKRWVTRFVPFGPYKGQHVFVNRTLLGPAILAEHESHRG